jgi:hypothetical protein
MATTIEEITEFQQFALGQVRSAGVDLSLEELLQLWRTRDTMPENLNGDDVHDAIRRGIAEADAGLGRPLDEFMDEFRQRHSIPQDS